MKRLASLKIGGTNGMIGFDSFRVESSACVVESSTFASECLDELRKTARDLAESVFFGSSVE